MISNTLQDYTLLNWRLLKLIKCKLEINSFETERTDSFSHLIIITHTWRGCQHLSQAAIVFRRNISMVRPTNHGTNRGDCGLWAGSLSCPVSPCVSYKINKKAILTSIELISALERQKRGGPIK